MSLELISIIAILSILVNILLLWKVRDLKQNSVDGPVYESVPPGYSGIQSGYRDVLVKLPFPTFLCEKIGGILCTPVNARAEKFITYFENPAHFNDFIAKETDVETLFATNSNVSFFQKKLHFQDKVYVATLVRLGDYKGFVMLEDMTPIYLKLDTISRSQAKYKSALLAIGEGVIIIHKEKIRELNTTAAEIFGVDPSEMMNQPVGSLIGFTQWNNLKEKFNNHSLVREYIIFQLEEKRHIELIGSEIEAESNDYLLMLKDLTKEKSQLEEINRLSRFKDNVFNSIPSALAVLDENNRMVEANQNFYKLLEIPVPDDDVRPDLFELVPQFRPYEPVIEEVRKEGNSIAGIENDFTMDNTKKRLSFSFLAMDKMKHKFVIMVFIDISKEYQLAESLKQAQKMEIIGQLAGGFVHDFNNVIGSISGVNSLLKMELKNDNLQVERVARRVEIIDLAIARAKELVSKLLVLGRKVESDKKLIDLRDELRESIEIVKPVLHKHITLEFSDPPFPVIVYADKTFLQQVFINLLQNANDAMAEKGDWIGISIHNLTNFPVNVDLDEEKEWIEVSFKDNGTGIPEEILDKIFTPFFTTKPKGKGTGLGLAMVYNLIREHGGKIAVTSELGQGTEFRIYLPRHDKVSDLEVSPEAEIVKGSGRVALVDDDEVIRLVGQNMLTQCGYDVVTFTDGKKFVQAIENSKNSQFDLLLLDLIMPEMNGFETFMYLKEKNYPLPVIIMTGFKADELAIKMKDDGAAALIQKPFTIGEISVLAAKCIKNK